MLQKFGKMVAAKLMNQRLYKSKYPFNAVITHGWNKRIKPELHFKVY